MTRLNIDKRLILYLMNEVAPLVQQATGWDLDLPTMNVSILPKNRGYEEIVLKRLNSTGATLVDENAPRGLLERLVEYVVEENVLSAYEPSTQELLVVRENVDDSNLDGLKVILGHELVHRGQHRYHPDLFERVDAALARSVRMTMSGQVDMAQMEQAMEEIKPIMNMIESHAAYVQRGLQQQFYPNAKIEAHFNLATILFRLIAPGKVSQYTDALPAVSAAGTPAAIQNLYHGL